MLELEHRFRAVDVHTRLDTRVDTPGRRRRAITPEELTREMRQAGIVRTVVFAGGREGSYLSANNAVARHAVDRPFVTFARLNGPRDPRETPVARLKNLGTTREDHHVSPEEIERYAYDDRFFGFTLAPAVDGLPGDGVLDRLEDVGLPLLVRVGEAFPPAALEATLLGRDLPVIAAHFGGYPLDRDLMDEAISMLQRYDEYYLDTSVVRYRDVLERAMREHPDRVLFGSGAPDVHPNVGVMELLTLDVPEDAMRKAFEHNPIRVVPALDGA